MNRKVFFDKIRASIGNGKLTEQQVVGFSKMLDYQEKVYPAMNQNAFAYLLATVWHETAHTMSPIKEIGGSKKWYAPAYGRGLIQCTHDANYKKFGCKNYDDALQWPTALDMAFRGSLDGMFTGKKLGEYFTATKNDWTGARRVINGTDRAALIAGYGKSFATALTAAKAAKPEQSHAQASSNGEKSVFDEIGNFIDWTRNPEEAPQQAPPIAHRDDALHVYLVPAIIAFIGALASADWNTAFDNPQASILVILTGAAAAAYQAAAPWYLKAIWRPKLA